MSSSTKNSLGSQLFMRMFGAAALVSAFVLISAFQAELLALREILVDAFVHGWQQAFEAKVYMWSGIALALLAVTHVRFWTTTVFSKERRITVTTPFAESSTIACTFMGVITFLWGVGALAYQVNSRSWVEILSGMTVVFLIGLVLVHKGTQQLWCTKQADMPPCERTLAEGDDEEAIIAMLTVGAVIAALVGRGISGTDLPGFVSTVVIALICTKGLFSLLKLSIFEPKVVEPAGPAGRPAHVGEGA